MLHVEPAAFTRNFNRRPFLLRHDLSEHPLFSLPRLIELARLLPGHSVEYNAGDVPLSLHPESTPRTGLSIEETIRRIEECRSWMVLKRVEQDPAYQKLLDQCLDQVQCLSEPLEPGMCRRQGFIFISSPGSVTPFHIDHEHNFLLQIRGHKTVTQFDAADRTVLSEREIEDFYLGAHRNLVYREEYQQKGQTFEIRPGTGLHFPVNAPHHVRTAEAVCISFSITFRTAASERRSMVYHVNGRMRRAGLVPSPVGTSPLADSAKFFVYRLWNRARRVVPSLSV